MTNDLISREAAKEAVKYIPWCDWSAVGRTLDELPAVDAAPVVHGLWIPNIREDTRAYPPYIYQNGFKCSLCGRVERSNKEPYCHCGAKMDAGDDTNAQPD